MVHIREIIKGIQKYIHASHSSSPFPGPGEKAGNYLIDVNNKQIRKEQEGIKEFEESLKKRQLDFRGMYTSVQEFLKEEKRKDKI